MQNKKPRSPRLGAADLIWVTKLELMEYRLHLIKRTDVVKAGALNHLHGGLEVSRNAHSIVGIEPVVMISRPPSL